MNDGPTEAVIAGIRLGREDVAILTLKTARPFTWRAGQYVSLAVDGFAPRYYSIANPPAPGAAHPEIHVRRAGKGGLSDHLVSAGRAGQAIQVGGPYGDLALDEKETMPLLLVAGGLGIAPLKALAEQALLQDHPGPVTLVWGTNYTHDQYLKDAFERMAARDSRFRFISVTGAPVSEQIASLVDDFSGLRIYLGGPPDMIVATKSLLDNKKVRSDRIHHDPLPPGFTPAIMPKRNPA